MTVRQFLQILAFFNNFGQMLIFSLTADTPAGRVSHATLSDQTRMELLVADFDDRIEHYFHNDEGDFIPVCDWFGVACDAKGDVTEARWDDMVHLSGSLCLEYLPETVLVFTLINNGDKKDTVEGTIETAKLPVDMEIFTLQGHNFQGSVDLTAFPEKLYEIDASMNALTGDMNLEKLPPRLELLNLKSNQFYGTVNLERLPQSLRFLQLSDNQMTGTLKLDELPPGLEKLGLGENKFEGSVDLAHLSRDLDFFDISMNNLSGSVRLDALPYELQRLLLGDNSLEGEVDLGALPEFLWHIDLSNNNFSGTINFDAMHEELKHMLLDGNSFTATIDTLGKAKELRCLQLPNGL